MTKYAFLFKVHGTLYDPPIVSENSDGLKYWVGIIFSPFSLANSIFTNTLLWFLWLLLLRLIMFLLDGTIRCEIHICKLALALQVIPRNNTEQCF